MENNTEAKETTKATKGRIKRMSSDDLVEVKSNFYGTLFYKSRVTGYECEWSNYGDVNVMTIAELQNMRNSQRKFFSENWIVLIGENSDDVLKYLQVDKYYENSIVYKNIDEIFALEPKELERVVSGLPSGMKDSVALKAHDMITSEELYNLKTIKALENALVYKLIEK